MQWHIELEKDKKMNNESKPCIMIVDDEPMIVQSLSTILKRNGYDVITCENGKEALSKLKENRVTVIVSDIKMPEISGLDLLQHIKEIDEEIPVILMTAYTNFDVTVEAVKRNAFDFLIKPVNTKILVHSIDKATKYFQLLQKEKTYKNMLEVEVKNKTSEIRQKDVEIMSMDRVATVGTLTAGIIHEINNPLTFVHSNVKNLNKFMDKIFELIYFYDNIDYKDDIRKSIEEKKKDLNYSYIEKRVWEILNSCNDGCSRIKKTITDIKSFARIDSRELENIDINECLDIALNILRHEYKNRIEIIKNYGQLPLIQSSKIKLNQVFINIINNACQAIEGKGTVAIETSHENEKISIKIKDSGSGIPQDVIDKIFNPFFTTKPVGKGTGLGLSISHDIIKEHNGTLNVESEKGKGSTFTICLPNLN